VPQRLVSLTPAMTEILYEIGAGDRLVGVTEHCDWPPQAARLAKVGSLRPDVEAVVALRPDLVLGTTNGLNHEAVEKLRELGLRLSIHPGYTLDDLHATILAVGRDVGAVEGAEQVTRRIRQAFARSRELTKSLQRPRALLVVSHDPIFAATPGSIPDDLIRVAGGVNVVGASSSEYVAFTVEQAIAARPEVIIDAGMAPRRDGGDSQEAVSAYWARWKDIPAVASGRVHAARDHVYLPGPRIDTGLADILKMLHPKLTQAEAPE